MEIEFKAINALLYESYGEYPFGLSDGSKTIEKPRSNTRLCYEITTTNHCSLVTGEKLKEMRGVMNVTPDAEWREGDKGIGGMFYLDTRSRFGYIIEVALPKGQFDNLLEVARFGHIPSKIEISVGDEFIDVLKDEWDNKSSRHLTVKMADISVTLAETRLQDKSEEAVLDDYFPTTRLQTRLLTQLVQKVNMKIAWLITVVAILGVLVIVFK